MSSSFIILENGELLSFPTTFPTLRCPGCMRETESLYRTGRKRGTANATHPQLPHPSFGGGGREVKFPAEDMENDDEYVHVLHKSLVWCKIVFLIIKEKKKTVFFFVFFLKKSRCILLIT